MDHPLSPGWGPEVARFTAQDEASPPAPGQLVLVGSSSVRRWETAFRTLSSRGVIQRGMGGAHLSDVALHLDALVLRHRPAAVLLFAGTNDVAAGRSAAQVVDAYRCVAQGVVGGGADLLWITITPAPSRASTWPVAAAVNDEVARLASLHPRLHVVDVATPFQESGPDPDLFVADALHLSEAGYALWTDLARAAVEAARPALPAASGGPSRGTYLRVDLGPDDGVDGWGAPAVDGFGIHWNRWHPLGGGAQVLAGERLSGLVSTTGAATGVELVISGGFRANGLRNGGLVSPDGARLGTLAVPEATADFFYTGDADDPGALGFSGLDPAGTYTLRLFASRSTAEERRETRYVVGTADGVQAEATLVTSGPGVGAGGGDGNDGELVVFTGLRPDAWGRLDVDVRVERGAFAYLNLLELEATGP